MLTKSKTFLLWLLIILVLLGSYIAVRTGIYEQQYIKNISDSAEKIVLSLAGFQKDKTLNKKDLSSFYEKITKKYNIAFIAVADKSSKILKAGKHEKYIKSTEIFDSIINSFQKKEFSAGIRENFLIRYYDQSRFYVFERNIAGGRILVVYPHAFSINALSLKMKIQLLLEIVTVLLISIILTAFIFAVYNRKNRREFLKSFEDEIRPDKKKIKKEKKQKKEKIHTLDIESISDGIHAESFEKILTNDLSENNSPKKKPESLNRKTGIVDENLESLTEKVFEIFSQISAISKPDTFILFLIDNRMDIRTLFEFKGNALVKTQKNKIPDIQVNEEIINEMKNSSVIYLEKSRKVEIPVLRNKSLAGFAVMTRNKQFTGPEVNEIKSKLSEIAPFMEKVKES